MENSLISKQDVHERRAALDGQLARARRTIADAEATILALDGAIQENNFYMTLLIERGRLASITGWDPGDSPDGK